MSHRHNAVLGKGLLEDPSFLPYHRGSLRAGTPYQRENSVVVASAGPGPQPGLSGHSVPRSISILASPILGWVGQIFSRPRTPVTRVKSYSRKKAFRMGNIFPPAAVENQDPSRWEPLRYNPESLYYDMSGEKYLLIFNHYKFKNTRYFGYKTPKTREGTDQDVKAMKTLFSNLGFKVLTYNDYIHDQIMVTVGRICQQDHSRTSCLAIAIMTHGEKGGELFAADRPYLLKDITNMFEGGHVTLVNKPKLFFIQACRGELNDPGKTVQYDGDDENKLLVPTHMDFLIACSTVEDYISWRDRGGSWFFQELCEIIKNYHQEMDLLHMLTLVTRNVALGHQSNVPKDTTLDKRKQIPETRFTLTKLVKFY